MLEICTIYLHFQLHATSKKYYSGSITKSNLKGVSSFLQFVSLALTCEGSGRCRTTRLCKPSWMPLTAGAVLTPEKKVGALDFLTCLCRQDYNVTQIFQLHS